MLDNERGDEPLPVVGRAGLAARGRGGGVLRRLTRVEGGRVGCLTTFGEGRLPGNGWGWTPTFGRAAHLRIDWIRERRLWWVVAPKGDG
eukprot:341543-Prymnesium_polylepis.1